MPSNIEIKVRLQQIALIRAEVAALADQGPIEIEQDDTFFRCETGRLKLRSFADGTGELIFYRRADAAGPKQSFYTRASTPEPAALREALTLAYGQIGRVRKHRVLFLIGRTRVHLDEVDGLGCFLELEVVLKDDETAEAGENEARSLMRQLAIDPATLIEVAYIDLLRAKSMELAA